MVEKRTIGMVIPAAATLFALATSDVARSAVITGTWKNTASGGAWSEASNWTLSGGSTPPAAAGDIAQYTDASYNATTNLDTSISLGQLTTAGGRTTWIITPLGGSTITMDNGASAATIAAPYRSRLFVNSNVVVTSGGLAVSAGTQAGANGAAVTIAGSITGTGNVTLNTSTANAGTAITVYGQLNNVGTVSVGGAVGTSTLMDIGPNVTKFTKTGSSTLALGSALALTAANGSTIGDGTNAMTLSLVSGKLTVANGAQRIASNVTANFVGGELAYTGTGNDTIQAIGASGQGIVTVSDGGTLNATTWTVPTTGGVLFRGIGQGTTDSVGSVKFGTAPTLTGNIIAQAYGDTSTSGNGTGFVTYDATKGVRLLAEEDYSSTLAAGANVSLAASTASGIVTINSLRLTNGGGITGSNTITLTTGNLLSTASSATIAAPLGATTLFATTIGDLTISSNFAGTNIVKNGAGKLTLSGLGQTTAYTGTTTVNGGTIVFGGVGGSRLGNVTVNNGATAQLGVDNMLSDGATITVNIGGTFTFNGKFDTVATLAGMGTITGGTGTTAGTVRLSNPTEANPVNSLLTGNLNLEVRGSRTLVLANPANSYSGYTQTQAGATIKIGANNALPVGTSLQLGSVGDTGNGTFDLNGNNQTVGSLTRNTTGTGTITNSLAVMRTFTVSSDSIDSDFSGVISSANLALAKAGTRTLTLSGTNSYGGATTITGGTLAIASPGSINGTSGITINGGGLKYNSGTALTAPITFTSGRISGTGAIATALTIGSGATLSPGNSIGTQAYTSGLTISGGTFDVELGRSGTTPISDLADVTGAVTLDTGSDLKLTLYSGLTDPQTGDIFYLINNDGTDAISGAFTKLNGADTTLSEGSLFTWNSQQWQVTYAADYGNGFTGGNDMAITVVPEPAMLALLGLGGLAFLRRRKNG